MCCTHMKTHTYTPYEAQYIVTHVNIDGPFVSFHTVVPRFVPRFSFIRMMHTRNDRDSRVLVSEGGVLGFLKDA